MELHRNVPLHPTSTLHYPLLSNLVLMLSLHFIFDSIHTLFLDLFFSRSTPPLLTSVLFFSDLLSCFLYRRQLNILALMTASSIIVMRPVTMLIMVLDPPFAFGRALAIAVWICFVWLVSTSVMYVLCAYTLPTMRLKQLQHSGEVVHTGYVHCPLPDFVPVVIKSYQMLDSRTILLRLSANSGQEKDGTSASARSPFPVGTPPGCYVTLRLGGVVREYTPVNIERSHAKDLKDNCHSVRSSVDIIVRLVPGGRMSTVLSSLLRLNEHTHNSDHKNDTEKVGLNNKNGEGNDVGSGFTTCNLECEVYGPLFHLPSKFAYFPHDGVNVKINSDTNDASLSSLSSSVSSSLSSPSPVLILIGGGTGICPFLNIIEASLRSHTDTTRIILISLVGEHNKGEARKDDKNLNSFSIFIREKIKYLMPSSKGRLECLTITTRFNKYTLAPWFCDESYNNSRTDNIRVWICGPPGFGANVSNSLTTPAGKLRNTIEQEYDLSFDREQIFILGTDDR